MSLVFIVYIFKFIYSMLLIFYVFLNELLKKQKTIQMNSSVSDAFCLQVPNKLYFLKRDTYKWKMKAGEC